MRIHPDTVRSVCRFHNFVESTKRHYSCWARVSVRRTQFGEKSPHQHRGMAPLRSRHDAADSVAKAASDRFALVETEGCMLNICSVCLVTRFTSWHRTFIPLKDKPSASRQARFTSSSGA